MDEFFYMWKIRLLLMACIALLFHMWRRTWTFARSLEEGEARMRKQRRLTLAGITMFIVIFGFAMYKTL